MTRNGYVTSAGFAWDSGQAVVGGDCDFDGDCDSRLRLRFRFRRQKKALDFSYPHRVDQFMLGTTFRNGDDPREPSDAPAAGRRTVGAAELRPRVIANVDAFA